MKRRRYDSSEFASDQKLTELLLEYYKAQYPHREITIIEIRRRHSLDFDYLMPLLRRDPPRSKEAIARRLGVSSKTIDMHIDLRLICAIPRDMYTRNSTSGNRVAEA